MFGIGASEMVIIAVVLLIAVGPTRLPKLLKSAVQMYREFRRATRELRASTGIDEILQDEDLKELRRPLHVPPAKQKAIPAGKPQVKKRALSYTERVQEVPPEGVDLAVIREVESRPSPEEAERIRAAKQASAAEAERIRAAKLAAVGEIPTSPEDQERIRAAKIASLAPGNPVESERLRPSKVAPETFLASRGSAAAALAAGDEDEED